MKFRTGTLAKAFSLIELLVVISILAIMMLGLLAIRPTGALEVTTAGTMVQDYLNLARATAIGRNRAVQVRFYRLPSASSGETNYRGLQLFVVDETGQSSALTKFAILPNSVIIDSSSAKYASLLYGTAPPLTGSSAVAGYDALPCNYAGFIFRPDGATNLSPKTQENDTWFVMIRSEKDLLSPPKNYYVLQIDPITGRSSIFRP